MFVPPPVVTRTLAVPAVPIGVFAVIEVSLTTVISVAARPPKVTPVAPSRFVPVMVTAVSPDVRPVDGDTLETVGKPVTVMV